MSVQGCRHMPGQRVSVQFLSPGDVGLISTLILGAPPLSLCSLCFMRSFLTFARRQPVFPLPRGARGGQSGNARGGDARPSLLGTSLPRIGDFRFSIVRCHGFQCRTGSTLLAWNSRIARSTVASYALFENGSMIFFFFRKYLLS